MDRLSENEPSVSLDFVDLDHVLITFNRKKLLHRNPDCPPDHEDRLMHAAILELPSGKVVKETDWFLHDRRRYLWPLGSGQFLLRRLNDLYRIDASLHEKLLFRSPSPLLWVTVTPDGSQIIVETAASPRKDSAAQSSTHPEPKFVAQFLDAKRMAVLRTLPLNQLTTLNATSAGYADFVHKNEIWLLRFGSDPAKRHNLARVRSQTAPNVIYSSNNSLLIGRCPSPSCDYSVTAFTLTGHRLWQQHWPRFRYFPAVCYNEDNSRFGISTLRIVSKAAPFSGQPADPDDAMQPEVSQLDVFQQDIQIFETASGTPLLSLPVSPAMLTGQNFSLSPDGRRLAVLQGPQLDLFDLPSLSEQELARFSALKSDLPSSYALGTEPDSDASPADSAQEAPAQSEGSVQPAATDALAESTEATPSADKQSEAVSPPPVSAMQPIATIRVSAKAVAVDVVVTDSKGHPIKGLHQQDFQLLEDGKSQDLRAFHEFSDGQEVDKEKKEKKEKEEESKAAAAAPTKPSLNVFTNKSHAPDVGSVTLVLFDMLNTVGQDQSFARQQLIKYLESKPKDLQFALCTLSAGTTPLRLIQGFTPDETTLLAAARGKRGVPRAAAWQESATSTARSIDTVGELAKGGPTSGYQTLLGSLQGMQAEQQGTDTDQRVSLTLDSLMQLARYLSGIPGRKNIVWLSGSFPVSITVVSDVNNSAAGNRNYNDRIRRVTNLLADAQIAVYPVDVRGLQGGGLSADSSSTPAPPPSGSTNGPTAKILAPSTLPGPSPELEAMSQLVNERETLTQVATATGGKAFFNTNGVREAIGTAAEQGSNHYTLSYNPANKNYDGKFRKIKVQLAEKGYTLHYRQGYYADDSRTRSKDAELAVRTRAVAMQHSSPLSHQLQFSVRVTPVGSRKKVDRARIGEVLVASTKTPALPAQVEAQHYSIDYTFDGSELRFLPLENANYGNTITLMVTSFDREGNMLTGVANVGTREVQAAAYEKVIAGEFGVQQEIDIPVEAASLRLGIQDQMSNRLGTVDIPLPVPPAPDAPRHLKHPLPEIEPD